MNLAVFGDSMIQGNTVYWLDIFMRDKGHSIVKHHYWGGTNWCDWRNDAIYHGQPGVIASFSGNMITPCTQGRGTAQQVYTADVIEFCDIQVFLGRTTWLFSSPGQVGTHESANWHRSILASMPSRYPPGKVHYVDAARSCAVNGVYQLYVPCDDFDLFVQHCFYGLAVLYDDDLRHLRPAGGRRFGQTMAYVLP